MELVVELKISFRERFRSMELAVVSIFDLTELGLLRKRAVELKSPFTA
jgi:hypothetical protein